MSGTSRYPRGQSRDKLFVQENEEDDLMIELSWQSTDEIIADYKEERILIWLLSLYSGARGIEESILLFRDQFWETDDENKNQNYWM